MVNADLIHRMGLSRRLLMRAPSVWLKLRAWKRKSTGQDDAELGLLRFLVARDRCAVDVGANNGIYTQALLTITDRVVAVEPNPDYTEELRRLFGPRITLISAALSDSEGTAELAVPMTGNGKPLGTVEAQNPLTQTPCKRMTVPMTTLDDQSLDDVGFIKIDVEGHEERVVAGGEATIRRCRPILLIEAEDRHRCEAVKRLGDRLASLGYAGFFLNEGVLASIATFDRRIHQPEAAVAELRKGNTPSTPYCNNFIFVPVSAADGHVDDP